LTDLKGVAGPSGLSTEEKEKEKMPGEMEIEDVAGLSRNPATNTALAMALVKVKEVEGSVNWVRYKVVEVPLNKPAQPVTALFISLQKT
jgi:hypothetical protein